MIKKYIARIKEEAYKEGYSRGIHDGTRSERADVYRILTQNADIAAFQSTAKTKQTKTITDSMQLGYNYAVDLLKDRWK